MSQEVVARKLLLMVVFAIVAVTTTVCGGGNSDDSPYAGGRLSTNDIANPYVQVPTLSSAWIRDTFAGSDGQLLSGRQPEFGRSTNSVWLSPGTTNWRTDDESLVLDVIVDRDIRAAIDVGRPRNWVRARIARETGLAGLVTRYSNQDNWVMVWSDGTEVVAGQNEGGVYTELGRQPFKWPGSGVERYFDLIDTGSRVLAFIDGQEVLQFSVNPANVAQGAGVFTRNSKKNRFDDFTVWATPTDLVEAPKSGAERAQQEENTRSEVDENGAVVADDPLVRGAELFGELGCGGCHTVSGRDDAQGGVAPGLDGVGGRAGNRIPGTPATAYLRESIVDPTAYVVTGFPAIMPSFEGDMTSADLESLIAYLLSLSTGDTGAVTGIADSMIGGGTVGKGRIPEYGPADSVWINEAGHWSLVPDGMSELAGANSDNRLVIRSGIESASTSVNIKWSGRLAGIVARYTDPNNWIMAWYDPGSGIAIGVHSAGGFKEINRVEFDWGEPGTVRRMKIDDYGDIVDVWVDETLVYSFDPGAVPLSDGGGLFSRGYSGNEFSNFAILELGDRPEGLSVLEHGADRDGVGPQVVLPPDPELAPKFLENWRDQRREPYLAGSLSDRGYTIELVEDEGIAHPISITFGGGALYVASGQAAELDKGAVYALEQLPGGGFGSPVLVAVGFNRPTGILYAFGSLYVSSRGVITRLHDTNGDFVADEAEEIVTGLPFGKFGIKGQATEHQTHALRLGPDNRIYVAQGANSDRGPLEMPLEGTIFSMLPDGSDIQVFATGFRNPFDFDFNSQGVMFTADNGANVKGDENPPDELHLVKPGGDHGFPNVFGDPPAGSDVEKPLRTWFPNIAPGGMEFYRGGPLTLLTADDLLLAKWNKLAIVRLRIELIDDKYVLTEEENVIAGFGTPATDVTIGPDGNIYVADWGGGRIFRVRP